MVAGIQPAVPCASPVSRVTSPGLAANLSKPALALPAPQQAEAAQGGLVPSPRPPGDGGAAPAPASPQLLLSPSIPGPGSLLSWQGRGTTPAPGSFLGRGAARSGEPGGSGQGWDPTGAGRLHGGAQAAPLTPAGSGEGAQVGSAGMETWENTWVPTTPAHPGPRTARPSSPVTCCCRAGQEPRAAPLPLALVNSLWRCIFNSFTEPI